MPKAKTSQHYQHSSHPPVAGKGKNSSEVQEAHLLIVEDDRGVRKFPLGGETYSIGRDDSCDICLNSLFVSRRHATLVRRSQKKGKYEYELLDGDGEGQRSSNGISVNGRKIQQSHSLKHQDKVVFGSGVKAKYFKQEKDKTGKANDPFEITLIDPSMMDESED
ncbi:MAG: FHA domain-containing protein [Coleofasciculaceae cyanobacterium]